MRSFGLSLSMLFVLMLSLPASPADTSRAFAVRVSSAPVIDGRLDDPAWASAKEYGGFVVHEKPGRRAQVPTYVRLLTDGTTLFVGFRCIEPKVDAMKALSRDRDSAVWEDDCVEVILDPTNERKKEYHLIVNAAASRYDAVCTITGRDEMNEDSSWNGDWQAATSTSKGEWYAEIGIPFASIGASPEKNPCLGINLARARYAGELSSWSPTWREFANPACLGELVIPPADGAWCLVDFPSLDRLLIGSHSLPMRLKSMSTSPVQARYSYRFTGPGEEQGDTGVIRLDPGKEAEVRLTLSPTTAGEYTLALRVDRDTDSRPLYSLERKIHVPRILSVDDALYALYHKRAQATISVDLPESDAKSTELRVYLLKQGPGEPLDEKRIRPPYRSPIEVRFDLRKHPKGTYVLRANLLQGGKVIATAASHPLPYNPTPKVGLGEHGFLLVDGKPFFPIGMYQFCGRQAEPDESVVKEASEAGFNTTVYYHYAGTKPLELLDICQRYGVKAFIYPSTPLGYQPRPLDRAKIVQDVKLRRNHPALLGWYLVDEPEGIGRADFEVTREFYQIVKETDTEHPCSLVIMGPRAARDYRDCTDIMWIDPYPIPHSPVTYVTDCVSGAVQAVEKDKPTWCVPQAFDWSVWKTGKVNEVHRPTPDEVRCMTYLALVHGAKGIIYWTHTGSKYYIRDYPEHWQAMKRLAGELRTLSPVLLTADVAAKLIVAPEGATLDTMVKQLKDATYVFAVNHSSQPCRATFRLSTGVGPKAEVMFEDRILDLQKGSWTDDFKSLQVHVYRIPRN